MSELEGLVVEVEGIFDVLRYNLCKVDSECKDNVLFLRSGWDKRYGVTTRPTRLLLCIVNETLLVEKSNGLVKFDVNCVEDDVDRDDDDEKEEEEWVMNE